MTDKIPSSITERLGHPIFGPMIISWFALNWPVLVYFAGAVTEPGASFAGIKEHLIAASDFRLGLYPILTGLAWAFGAPLIASKYYEFDLYLGRQKERRELISKGLNHVNGDIFLNAILGIEKVEKIIEEENKVLSEIQDSVASLEEATRRVYRFSALPDAKMLMDYFGKLKTNLVAYANAEAARKRGLAEQLQKDAKNTSNWIRTQ